MNDIVTGFVLAFIGLLLWRDELTQLVLDKRRRRYYTRMDYYIEPEEDLTYKPMEQ